MHFRYNIPNWPEPVKKLPANYCVKAVDNVQMLSEAKAVNPGIIRILRHFTTDQNPADTLEGNKTKARQFLKTFIDGTFLNGSTAGVPHRETDYVEDWNEYGWFVSQSAEEHRRFRLWTIAFLDVWYQEYWPDLGTNACIANIPVGNNLDLQVAERVAFWTNIKEGRIPRVGYHGYWPVQNKQIVGQDAEQGWWKWYAGRFDMIDADLRSRGITIHWALTESGAVGAIGTWPNIGLGPEDGWRRDYVHGGDLNSYLVTTDQFMAKWAAWNKANNHRCLSPNIYDSSQGQDEWKQFQLWSNQLDEIVTKVFVKYPAEKPGTEPAPPPPPPPPEDDMRGQPRVQYKRIYHVMPQDMPANLVGRHAGQIWEASKGTVGGSWDDAMIGDLDSREVVAYDVLPADYAKYIQFRDTYYPGVVLKFMPWLAWPLDRPKQTSFASWAIFGAERDYGPHEGLDIAANTGDSVFAMRDGVVIWASNKRRSKPTEDSLYGNHIIIDHGSGWFSWYAHLDDLISGIDDVVYAGDLIGGAGSTGNSTGPHLHINVQSPNGLDDYIVAKVTNPRPLLGV